MHKQKFMCPNTERHTLTFSLTDLLRHLTQLAHRSFH